MIAVLSWGAGMFFESGRSSRGRPASTIRCTAPYGRFAAATAYLNIAASERAASGSGSPRCSGVRSGSPIRVMRRVLERRAHRAELTAAIEEVLRERDVAEWWSGSTPPACRADPVLDVAQVFADPQVLARRNAGRAAAPRGSARSAPPGLPVNSRATPGASRAAAPRAHGEHTDEVLRRVAASTTPRSPRPGAAAKAL